MTDLADLDLQPHQLAHLPIAAECISRLGILRAVDEALPRDGRNKVSDAEAMVLAGEIRKKIEEGLEYPGQIKVMVIRETRAIEYAK